MSDKPKIPYNNALATAKALKEMLAPFCEQIRIVGSIRRQRRFVGDIELLFIPRFAAEGSLFSEMSDMVDLADREIDRLVKVGVLAKRPNVNGSPCWGKQNKLAVHVDSGIPVDFFSTTAPNWFVALVIRTGGKRTNLALTMGANHRGFTLHAYGSGFSRLSDGEKVQCKSEEEVFRFAGVPFVDPQFRL